MSVQTQVAVVTGGGGIGIACAEALAPGHRLVLLERAEAQLASALDRLRAAGVDAEGIPCDVLDPGALAGAVARVSELGPLSALVHTAGVFSAASAQQVFEINFVGTANVLDAFLPAVGEGTAGVCIASIGGHKAGTFVHDDLVVGLPAGEVWAQLARTTTIAANPTAAYSMSKRGVIVLCQRYARDWGARGGRLVTVSPGVVATDMAVVARGQAGKAGNAVIDAATPQRAAAPSELAAVIAFLCSPGAAYVNGCDLRVDGGSVANLQTNPDLREALDAFEAASAFAPAEAHGIERAEPVPADA